MSNRIKIFDLLLKNNGELTTSGITKGLRISEPTARRTMREFHALRIADIFTITEYTNAELKITLRSEYDWFKTEEFKTLRDGFFPGYDSDDANVRTDGHNDYNGNAALSSQPHDGAELESGACDSQDRHTLKINPPPDADKKNNSRQLSNQQQDESAFNLEPENVDSDKGNTNDIKPTTTDDKCTLQEQRTQCIEPTTTTNSESTLQERTQCDIKTDPPDIIEKNNVCACGSNDFQHVTQSHCHTLGVSVIRPVPADIETITLQEILSMIKAANGSQVASSTCIASLHSRNEQIRNYLGDNLTSRDNRKVRNLCLKIIRPYLNQINK